MLDLSKYLLTLLRNLSLGCLSQTGTPLIHTGLSHSDALNRSWNLFPKELFSSKQLEATFTRPRGKSCSNLLHSLVYNGHDELKC